MSSSRLDPPSALRLARAVAAVPPARLWARLVHETSRRTAAALPRAWRERLAGAHQPAPAARPGYLAALRRRVDPGGAGLPLTVTVLGHPHLLAPPIDWEPAGKGRLWHFTLHYFDWAVAAVAAHAEASAPPAGGRASAGGEAGAPAPAPAGGAPAASPPEASSVPHAVFDAMRSWTAAVPFGRYDAWHPYPTAKRLVAWTYLFATFPDLLTPELEASHWLQTRYLARNLERHAGGNHLLQDLCALVVAGLRYRGDAAEDLVARALRELAREFPRQLTADGCHYELSAAYHLQAVVMLAEALACAAAAGVAAPAPLPHALEAMTAFAEGIRLPDGSYPLWSDSARDTAPPLDVVVALARTVLEGRPAPACGAALPHPYAELCASAAGGRAPTPSTGAAPFRPLAPPSGYHVLRGEGVAAAFDGADTGARDLPGHGHADCLNVDVVTASGPLVVESGTSTYDPGVERDRERGTAAHDTVEVAGIDQSEMWGSFRVADPARTFDRAAGESAGWRWATAAHDGYVRRCGVTHRRWVGVRGDAVVVLDALDLAADAAPTAFRLRWHLAPGVTARAAGEGAFALTRSRSVQDGVLAPGTREPTWLRVVGLGEGDVAAYSPGGSFHAERFGHVEERGYLEVTGTLAPGRRYLATVLSPQETRAELRREGATVTLVTPHWPHVVWRDAPGPLVPSAEREAVGT